MKLPTWRTLQLDANAKCGDLTCTLTHSQRRHAIIWTACKNINASGLVAPTTFGTECCLALIFGPIPADRAARLVCESSRTCCMYSVCIRKFITREFLQPKQS